MQVFYTVLSGDSLYQLAQKWYIPLESLVAANNLASPYTLIPGQQLSVPPGVNTGTQTLPYYVVKSGDTLYNLANRYNVATERENRWELIQQENRLPSTTITPGMQLAIPFAPPGGSGLIAYTSNRTGSYEIWLYNPQTGANFPLTTNLGEDYTHPSWSPNSGKIAFIGKNGVVYILDIPTGSTAQIDQIEPNTPLTWSPNSQILSYRKQNNIVLYNIIQHTSQTLHLPGAEQVQWFPSGNELLYAIQNESGSGQLNSISIFGTNRRKISENPDGPLHDLQISPNGAYALYTSPGASISLVYTVELATGKVTPIPGGPLAKNYHPTWSPNSALVLYSATFFPTTSYYSYIQTTDRLGQNNRIWAISHCYSSPVSWSPDGNKIAYLSGCGKEGATKELWILDRKHPVPIQMNNGGRITALQWSPSAKVSIPKRMYRSDLFKVGFFYPANWLKVSDERYEGIDGYFQIAAISSDNTLREVCRSEAFHQLKPYGSRPRVTSTRIHNQDACYIYPSTDQPPEMRNQAALIVTYPWTIEIGNAAYQYLIIWADADHINELGKNPRFFNCLGGMISRIFIQKWRKRP